MKATQLITTAFITAILVASPMTAMAGKGKSTASKRPSTATVVLAPLSDPEIATLKWMREEEKLARDIYVAMSTKYPQKIFRNIAAWSETLRRHWREAGAVRDRRPRPGCARLLQRAGTAGHV